MVSLLSCILQYLFIGTQINKRTEVAEVVSFLSWQVDTLCTGFYIHGLFYHDTGNRLMDEASMLTVFFIDFAHFRS